jgi:hypothetical protein
VGQRGYLFIADITGYTSYLSTTELDHARSTLQDLLNLLLREIRSPLQVSKLEGDAVLAFTPDGAFARGQTLVEMVEGIYGSYRRALELMTLNTTCTCRACANIDKLDLKFCVHHGEYAKQSIGQFVELVGTDVNLVHRLLKNGVVERIGSGAYALYTDAAVEAAGIRAIASETMLAHSERYDHIGEVECFIQPMHEVWRRLQDAHRIEVDSETAVFEHRFALPVPLATAWEYLTRPETRALLTGSEATDTVTQGPRTGVGDAYVCAHGDSISEHHVVDWQPFDYYSYRASVGDLTTLSTVSLSASDQGTDVVLRARAAEDTAEDIAAFARLDFEAGAAPGVAALRERVASDAASGTVLTAEPQAGRVQLDVAAAVRFGLEQRASRADESEA